MSFWVYVLKCADGTYYTGHSDDLERRVGQHQSGHFPGYTHERRPVELMFADWFDTRVDALERERQIKDWSRAKKEALFRQDWPALVRAAQGRTGRVSQGFSTSSNQTEFVAPDASPAVRFEPVEKTPHARTPTVRFELVENPVHHTPPAIVLVRPQLGENIGKAARAMLNFGLTDLRLVTPRDGWPNPDAGPAASGADSVLANARVFDSVAEAVADCAHVYATTVRKRGVVKPVMTPDEAATAMRCAPERSAILFGPERAGLESDDVALARTILTVPINPDFGSLNLAQAVILVAYEWSKGQALAVPPQVEIAPPADQDALEGLIVQIDGALDHAGFYFPPDKVPTTRRAVRSILTKPGWSAQEVRTLRGAIAALTNPRPKT